MAESFEKKGHSPVFDSLLRDHFSHISNITGSADELYESLKVQGLHYKVGLLQ